MSLVSAPMLWVPPPVELDAVQLRVAIGDRLELRETPNGVSEVVQLRVLKRVRKGWRLENIFDETDVRTLGDLFLHAKRCDGDLVILPKLVSDMSDAKRARMMTPTDARTPRERLEIDCRLAYCQRVDELLSGREAREEDTRGGGAEREVVSPTQSVAVYVRTAGSPAMTVEEACELSRIRTWRDNEGAWRSELRVVRGAELSEKAGRAVLPSPGDKRAEHSHVLQQPTCKMVRSWYERWKNSDRPDLELGYDHGGKGNRAPKLKATVGGEDPYVLMKSFGDRYYATRTPMKVRAIYQLMEEKHPGFQKVVRNVSTLQRFFDRQYAHSYNFAAAVEGPETAGRDHAVGPRSTRPTEPLAEIEIDHCLADLIVVDDVSKRPLGRPWITAAIDRCTRMIVGIHVSFELPSWGSVAKCLTHAFWPKDLRPYRIGVDPETTFAIVNDWPCDGIPGSVWTDRGLEFKGASLKASASALGFAHYMLPARSPQLKGTIERFFGTMHAQVYDHLAGRTFHNIVAKGDYKSVREAKVLFSELRQRLLKWIVDDYHVSWHSGLGDYPLRAWMMGSMLIKSKPAPDFAYLQQVLGQYRYQTISKDGVRIQYHRYFHPCMKEEVDKNGPGHKYHIRFDPFDLGHIWFLPSGGTSYVQVPSGEPDLTVGVSMYQSTMRRKAARLYGARLTPENLREISAEVDRIAAERMADGSAKGTAAPVARYFLPNGRFFTPVAGWDGIPKKWSQIIDETRSPSEPVGNVPLELTSSEVLPIAFVPDPSEPAEDWRAMLERQRREIESEAEDAW